MNPLLQILRLAALSLAVQFCLDALVFRTGWYGDYLEPESYAGSYEATLLNEQTRRLAGSHRVLVLGDSAIAEGFSAPLANQTVADPDWFFSNAGTPAATPRAWYYLLRDLDPNAKRYNVIVLPVTDYADADGLEPPDIDKEADRDVDLNRLIVRLRLTDTFTFPFTYLDPEKKFNALAGTLFKGYVYSRDVQEFLRAPVARLAKLDLYDEHSREWKDAYTGQNGSLEGLTYDPARGKFGFPPSVAPAVREAIEARQHPERLRVEGYRRAYREKWLGAIINRYQAAGATIVLFRVPFRPVPLHAAVSPNGPTFVEQVGRMPRVVVLDPNLFADLETPALFFDAWHMNSSGRTEFTPRLARAVVDAVNSARGKTP
jgi:hypothetical protein